MEADSTLDEIGWRERRIDAGPLAIRAVDQGEGPLVLMIHGFPGLAYSWRHQMTPLAKAGYHAVAIDLPGYGGSDGPLDPALYASDRMQQYLMAVLDAFGAERAVIVGQDFGAQHSWNLTVRSPERGRRACPAGPAPRPGGAPVTPRV